MNPEISKEDVQAFQEMMQQLSDWYTNQWMPAVRAYLDAVAEWWEKVMVPAIRIFAKLITEFINLLRRGLLVTRWYFRCAEKYRPWFPWRVSRWLARRWPVRWLPRFVEGDLDEFLAAVNMAAHLADPTW